MKKSVLKSYAHLIAAMGANVRLGQDVIIRANLDQPDFIAMLAEECYLLGAARVDVEWSFLPLEKLGNRFRSLENLSSLRDWEIAKISHRADTLPAMIYIDSADPDGLSGIDEGKHAAAMQAKYPITKPFTDKMENRYQWCIAAVPGRLWAKRVFPQLSPARAEQALWSAILKAARITDDPCAEWRRHNENLQKRCEYLNSLSLSALEYSAENGTRLRVGLIENSVFCGGCEKTASGVVFNPNIPSEEIFISPKRGEAEGTVFSTRPLSYQGRLIENFFLRFENGKVAEAHAEKNDALLQTLISMDAGAAMLGECALIPFDSPIRRENILFYSTLFDENASCHLALGEGFSCCIKDHLSVSLDECRKMGINDSMIHEDFMIGTKDLNIDGIRKGGRRVPIFRAGGWAF